MAFGYFFVLLFSYVIFDSFSGSSKNALPHESVVNSSQIEDRAPVKAKKKARRNEEESDMKTKAAKSWFLVPFWLWPVRSGGPGVPGQGFRRAMNHLWRSILHNFAPFWYMHWWI